jgi:hypothetical protein
MRDVTRHSEIGLKFSMFSASRMIGATEILYFSADRVLPARRVLQKHC